MLLVGAAAAQPKFESASVRPVEKFAGNFPARRTVNSPGRAEFHEFSLKDLLFIAYRVQFFQLRTESWMEDAFFDVRAATPAGASPDDAALMLQDLLVERFKLKMRRDTRQMRGYVLTVGKEGAKFAESPPITAPVEPEAPRPGGLRFDVDKEGFVILPRGTTNIIAAPAPNGVTRLTAARFTMAAFCGYLRRLMQQPVMDQTGLTGIYDFRVAFATLVTTPGNSAPPEFSEAPTVVQAVDRQLGLKLVSQTVPTEILVIEHIERRPVEN